MEIHEEKAKEIFEKFYSYQWPKQGSGRNFKIEGMSKDAAKYCASILVDEVISNIDAGITYHPQSIALPINKDFWLRVKNAIDKL